MNSARPGPKANPVIGAIGNTAAGPVAKTAANAADRADRADPKAMDAARGRKPTPPSEVPLGSSPEPTHPAHSTGVATATR